MIIELKETVKGLYTEAKDENGKFMPFINPKGDCIDLRAAEDYVIKSPFANVIHQKRGIKTRNVEFDIKVISLGICIHLPKGLVGRIEERSSGAIKLHLKKMGGGFIDNCYNGNDDEWKVPMTALEDKVIHKGDRICQFHIELSQFATPWQKIKWLFSKPKFVWVNEFNTNENRSGFGTTGVK